VDSFRPGNARRGLRASRRHRLTEIHALALVCRRVPHAVVRLLSALRFHDLTTQLSSSVWETLEEKLPAR
jgi:hypothetical protein